MALVALTLRAERKFPIGSTISKNSVGIAVDDSVILEAVPSLCKILGKSDGLVNSKVTISVAGVTKYLWVTQTVADIAALS